MSVKGLFWAVLNLSEREFETCLGKVFFMKYLCFNKTMPRSIDFICLLGG